MKFATSFIVALASVGAVSASCFCSSANGCKCDCGHSDLVPDSQWAWHGDGQGGYVGNYGCGPSEGTKLDPDSSQGGDAFGWTCLYIKCN